MRGALCLWPCAWGFVLLACLLRALRFGLCALGFVLRGLCLEIGAWGLVLEALCLGHYAWAFVLVALLVRLLIGLCFWGYVLGALRWGLCA